MITLYSYFRSSTAYRVRIALHLKGLAFETIPVHLARGEQFNEMYRLINPMAAVPTLVHDDFTLTQSLAILEYLDQIAPEPALLHGNAQERAYIRQISMIFATDIHPLTNLRVLKHIGAEFGADEEARNNWYAHWAMDGMTAIETLLRDWGLCGKFVLGDKVSMADLCLVPQMYNMRRYNLPLNDLPLCRGIEENCMEIAAFQRAAPEAQADAPADLEPIHGNHFKKQTGKST